MTPLLIVIIIALALWTLALSYTVDRLRGKLKIAIWERDIAQRHLDLAESAIHSLHREHGKKLAYWKEKDKKNRQRAFRAEQIAIERAKRLASLKDVKI